MSPSTLSTERAAFPGRAVQRHCDHSVDLFAPRLSQLARYRSPARPERQRCQTDRHNGQWRGPVLGAEPLLQKHAKCPLTKGMKDDLEFLIELRHEIEHRSASRIDDAVSTQIQACCINFNEVIKAQFGPQYGLKASDCRSLCG